LEAQARIIHHKLDTLGAGYQSRGYH
jgi:hypothetical protein